MVKIGEYGKLLDEGKEEPQRFAAVEILAAEAKKTLILSA